MTDQSALHSVSAPRQAKWYRGQLMAFSGIDGQTRYRDELVARTTRDPAGVEIVMPARARVSFEAEPESDIVASSDWFEFHNQQGLVRGALLDCDHLLIEGACQVEDMPDELTCLQRDGRLLLGMASRFQAEKIDGDLSAVIAARSQWMRKLSMPAGAEGESKGALFHAISMMKSQVYAPEGKLACRWTTPDRWPHYDMWLWDSGFHAIGLRHLDAQVAMDAINAMFFAQREDGFLPHRANISGPVSSITQPPILAFAAWLVYEKCQDKHWLRELYPKLAAYVAWDLAHRDSDGAGLAEWVIDDDPLCRSGESGMDNSPRFDGATLLDAVDFNAFLALECEILARIANLFGETGEAHAWSDRHRRLCGLINARLWSEEEGFYFDYDPKAESCTDVCSSAGFLPLICGAPTQQQAEKLVKALNDPERFATAFPVPSIAANNTRYYAKDMWRGPVWININWLIVRGLERYGYPAEAAALREKTIQGIQRAYEDYGVLFEYYDDRNEVNPPELLRKEICDPSNGYRQVIHDFGWTAALYVDFMFTRA